MIEESSPTRMAPPVYINWVARRVDEVMIKVIENHHDPVATDNTVSVVEVHSCKKDIETSTFQQKA
jgi:hypothetical protein